MKDTAAILFVISLLLISCSPEPVFRISPQADQTTFYQGIEYVSYSQDGLILSMGYYRHSDHLFMMDVEIINESDSVIFADPTQFRYDAYDHSRSAFSTESESFLTSLHALDPEVEMLSLDMQLADMRASERTNQTLFLIGQGLSIASEIAAETAHDRDQISDDRHDMLVERQFEREEYQYSKMSLAERRKVWELDAMRKTHLYPGDYVRGLIFFENHPDAAAYTIHAEELFPGFKATFLQKKYKP